MVGFRIYSLKVTPLRSVVIGEVALSQEEPLSVDLTMFPEAPTPTKVLFPNTTPKRAFEVGEVALSQDDPLSVDFTTVPELPTPTNTGRDVSTVKEVISKVLLTFPAESVTVIVQLE